jgi:transposase
LHGAPDRVLAPHRDERIAAVSAEIEALAKQDDGCERLMTVPGVGPIISSAVVAAIGNGTGFKQGRDFGLGWGSCRSRSPQERAEVTDTRPN